MKPDPTIVPAPKSKFRFLTHWQHVTTLLVAIGIFFGWPFLMRLVDPTAGAFDAGYLHRPVVAAVFLLFGISSVWTVIGVCFPSVDKWCDEGGFAKSMAEIPDAQKPYAFGLLFLSLLAAYCACLWLVPV